MAKQADSGAGSGDSGQDAGYPGQRLGYPETGPGSIGGFGQRLVALIIDWALSLLIATGLLGYRLGGGAGGDAEAFKPLLVFLVMNVFLVGTAGSTIGHKLLGLRVERVTGGYAGPLLASTRSVLLCLAIPALIWDGNQRGLHDRAAGTAIRRTR